MALEATRQASTAITLHGRIQAMRGTWLGVLLHPQAHRAVVHLGDAGSGLQFWSLEPPSLLELIEVERYAASLPDRVREEQRSLAWNFNQGETPQNLFPVQATAASRSGDVIAVASGPRVHIYQVSADDAHLVFQRALPEGEASPVLVSLASDGKSLLTADSEGDMRIVASADGALMHDLGTSPGPTALAFIWKDRLAAAGDVLGRVTCWNARTGERHVQFQAHQGAIRSIHFDPRKRLLLTAGDDGVARVWSLEAGTQVGDDIRCAAPLLAARIILGGELCVLLDRKGNLLVADSQTGSILDTYTHEGRVWDMDVAASRGRIVLVGDQGLSILAMNAQQLLDLRPSAAAERHSMSGVRAHSASTPSMIAAVPGGSVSQAPQLPGSAGERRRVPSGTHQTVGRVNRPGRRDASVVSVLTDSSGVHVPVDEFFSSLGDNPLDVSHSQISTSGMLDPPEGQTFELDFEAADTSGPAESEPAQQNAAGANVGVVSRGPSASDGNWIGSGSSARDPRSARNESRGTGAPLSSPKSYRRFEDVQDEAPKAGLPTPAILGVALLAAVIAGTLTWFSVVAGESGQWAAELSNAQEQMEAELAEVEASLEAFESRQREQLEDLRARTSLPSEVERIERRTFRIIETERELASERLASVEQNWDQTMASLVDARSADARRRAGSNAFIAGICFLLIGLGVSRVMKSRQEV